MTNEIEIAEYQSSYQARVVELITHIQQEEYNIPIKLHDQPDLFSIEKVYQSGIGNFWVALHNSRVVGTIALEDIGNDLAALKKLFVEPDYRGKNFGTAAHLLHTVLGWARSHSIKEIILGTTDQFEAAHRFYEKNGFLKIKESELPPGFPKLKVDSRFYKYVL
ncbi:N-acetylglutamate synthase-like GNAT family acetyltransferase [Peribacillus deserti]|uniref:N-acetylglutamate synthase-like GNAT family acetyltransferase n=1 Tax=Peribacillus deserti TaxID=673318 RepID=A0ABS2QDI8_9BACI|nr:GNAT family N-acetyltransferase [Peribacillus deserti]MBM7691232.1 N-acetylglutamate synthase-like GNAT family acetyltransferase [Peribacillus deserti]